MNGFIDVLEEHARLIILRSISSTPGDSFNESILHDIVESRGINLSRDQLVTNMQWLEEQGLVSLSEPGGLKMATITQAGVDVAKGRKLIDGVKRPSPKT